MKTEDEALVNQAQQGSRSAIEELIRRYSPSVYNVAFRIMGNLDDASDASQEALLKVFVRLHHFRGEAAFSTWLFRVVTNTCLDELRRRQRNRCVSLDQPQATEDGTLQRQIPTDQDSPERLAERHELQWEVQKAIDQLPASYRVVVVLRDIQDLSYRDIAITLGCSLGTVKSKLHRARLALRRIMYTKNARPNFRRSAERSA